MTEPTQKRIKRFEKALSDIYWVVWHWLREYLSLGVYRG